MSELTGTVLYLFRNAQVPHSGDGSLTLSGCMTVLVAAGLLIAYFLLLIEVYLATYAIHRKGPGYALAYAGLPPSGKNPCTRRTLGSALVSRSGGPNGKLLNGKVGSPLAGRSNRNWGPLSDDG